MVSGWCSLADQLCARSAVRHIHLLSFRGLNFSYIFRMATHLEIRDKSGKFMKNCQSQGKVGEKWYCFSKCLIYVDIVDFISTFCQMIRVINVTFGYTADIMESRKNILSQGKIREKLKLKNNGHPDIIIFNCIFTKSDIVADQVFSVLAHRLHS